MKIAIDAKTKRRKDENGFLHVEISNISKEAVNPYYGYEIPNMLELGLDKDKVYYVYRKGDELKKGADTFNNLPLLRGHFEDSAEKPQTEHRVGSLGTDAVYNAPYLQNSLCITDIEAIEKIENNERVELSAAYRYEPKLESGTFDGAHYDIVMYNIRGNHVALVEDGRAGPDVVVADSKQKQGVKMSKLRNLKAALLFATMALDEAKCNADGESEAIEQLEDLVDKTALQVQRVEAESEGKDPKDFDINDDKDAFNAKEAYKFGENVERDKDDSKEDKEAMDSMDSEAEERAFLEMLGNTLTIEEMQKAKEFISKLKSLGATGEDEMNVKEAVKAGENEERRKLDSEHESKGASDKAFDVKTVEKQVSKGIAERMEAAKQMQVLIGEVDPLAFDSAAHIYLKACELNSVAADLNSAKHVATLLANTRQSNPNSRFMAQDSKQTSRFARLK